MAGGDAAGDWRRPGGRCRFGETVVEGGGGQDLLNGGLDADVFQFEGWNLVGQPSDYILDFSQAQNDRIDLTKFMGGTLQFIGSAGFSGSAFELRFEQAVNLIRQWVYQEQ